MMTLTSKIDRDHWKSAYSWLESNIGPCGTDWAYDNHWPWIKVNFAKHDDWVLFKLIWSE